jgi:hypothetical protein
MPTLIETMTARVSRLGTMYVFAACVEMVLLALINIFTSIYLPIYIIGSMGVGILLIVWSIACFRTPITPIAIFALIWLVLVPITSVAWPLMNELSLYGVSVILVGGFVFGMSGLLACWIRAKRNPNIMTALPSDVGFPKISKRMELFAKILLLIACIAIVANLLISKSIRLFSDSADKKTVDAFFGYTFLSNLGTIGALILVYSRKNSLGIYLLMGSYFVLELLTGQRWFATVTIILFFSVLAFVEFDKQVWKLTILLLLAIVVAFIFIANFRNSTDSFQRYFVDTGKYAGSAESLSSTELIRYFGMSQRNMEQVFSYDVNTLGRMQFTFTPIEFLFVKPTTLSMGTNINSYTASNILAYLYYDAGYMWTALLLLLGLALHAIYFYCLSHKDSLTARTLWGTCVIALSLSFFSYFGAYFYWIGIYPVMVFVASRLDSYLTKCDYIPKHLF